MRCGTQTVHVVVIDRDADRTASVHVPAKSCLSDVGDLLAVAECHLVTMIDRDGFTWRWRRTPHPLPREEK